MSVHDESPAWEEIASGAEFRALVAARRRFTWPALGFAIGWAASWVILAGWAPGALDGRVWGEFTVGYGLALTNFACVWLLGALYLRYASRTLDPLAARVRALAEVVAPAETREQEEVTT